MLIWANLYVTLFFYWNLFNFSPQIHHLPIRTHQPIFPYHMTATTWVKANMFSLTHTKPANCIFSKCCSMLCQRAVQHTERKALSYTLCIHTDAHDWLKFLWLTVEKVCHATHLEGSTQKPILLSRPLAMDGFKLMISQWQSIYLYLFSAPNTHIWILICI